MCEKNSFKVSWQNAFPFLSPLVNIRFVAEACKSGQKRKTFVNSCQLWDMKAKNLFQHRLFFAYFLLPKWQTQARKDIPYKMEKDQFFKCSFSFWPVFFGASKKELITSALLRGAL